MDDAFQNYKKSGEILAKTFELVGSIIKPGIHLLEIAERAEKHIREQSAQPAFPVNISINEIAAHYSPIINDDSTIPENSIVKVDAGVSVDGYLSDAARTFIFDDKWQHMKDTARKALDEAIEIVKPNESVFRVGEIVQKCIEAEGFKPIVNLSGHSMSQYSLHDGVSIPNYSVSKKIRDDSHRFQIGTAYAIEPFVTTGIGRVTDSAEETIFRQFRKSKSNNMSAKISEIYQFIDENFHRLPFSWRWLYNAGFSIEDIEKADKRLHNDHVIHGYPVLIEATKNPVTQEEETLFVGKKQVYVITSKK
ncbi:MAG: type II methionyl aminopeptidase [Candidatus Heimdallarchaeota archaeon]|nr:type II methionyl aminopeptidase [Candidatus Heimdallarchaeota archaeon]